MSALRIGHNRRRVVFHPDCPIERIAQLGQYRYLFWSKTLEKINRAISSHYAYNVMIRVICIVSGMGRKISASSNKLCIDKCSVK